MEEYEIIEKNGVKQIIKQRYIPKNPKITNRSEYFLTRNEIKLMKETALTYGKNAVTYHAMICLLVQDLFSRADVVNLKNEYVHLDERKIVLPLHSTKKRQPRICPISNELKYDLLQLVSDKTYVFTHKTKGELSYRKYTVEQINNIIAKIGRKVGIKPKAGFKHVNTHIFRRSGVVLAKEKGFTKDEIRVIGGWANFKYIDEVYGTPTAEQISKLETDW